MNRLSKPYSIAMTWALAALPAALSAQSENLLAIKTIYASTGSLNASSEATEALADKKLVPESQPTIQTGNLRASAQGVLKSWNVSSILTGAPHPNRKWTIVAPGSLPLAVAIQPDASQKYGTNPAILEVHFGHRP